MDKSKNVQLGKCAIAAAERRLHDAAEFWLHAYEEYFDPQDFRINLQAAIQAFRSVTFVLQAQKASIPGFEPWYEKHQNAMRKDPVMRWLVEARNFIEKQGDLVTRSRFTVTLSWAEKDQVPLEIPLPVETRAEDMAKIIAKAIPAPFVDDESLMRLERHWVDSQLPDEEVLTVLVHCYSRLSDLLLRAHELLDDAANSECSFYRALKSTGTNVPEAMLVGEFPRTVWFKLKKGVLAGYDSTSKTVSREEAERKVSERYPGLAEAFAEQKPDDSFNSTCLYYFKAGKLFLERDGYHVPIAIVGTANVPLMFQFRMDDRADKHVFIREIASRCARAKACWCIFICEAWTKTPQSLHRYAADDPRRAEALVLHAVHTNGSSIVCSAPFSKRTGKIVFEANSITENVPPGLMLPILLALRKHNK